MDRAFVNREAELAALEAWWEVPGPRLAAVWGRRRMGKTALIQRFAASRKAIFHTGTRRPVADELRSLSATAAPFLPDRDLTLNPFRDWADLFESLTRPEEGDPVLLVLDEFPELVATSPELPSVIRAAWDRVRPTSRLRLLLSGSAVRVMEEMFEERAPLYGRCDLALHLQPFRPHEAALMLGDLEPADRALVWGIVGGIPMYLRWWNQRASVRENLAELACRPGAPLLTEGQLALATEGDAGELSRQVLYAIASGRTKHNEIADAVRADPTRTLDRLVDLRLVERMIPVTEDPRRTRRRLYRIADNFLAFWLGVLAPYQTEIERGLGKSILSVMMQGLDDHMGPRFEEAFRWHLRRLAEEGALGDEIVAIGPFWRAAEDRGEIDAVVLSGRLRVATWVGEATWTRAVDGPSLVRDLQARAALLPRVDPGLRYAVCARDEVRGTVDLAVTAEDIFGRTPR